MLNIKSIFIKSFFILVFLFSLFYFSYAENAETRKAEAALQAKTDCGGENNFNCYTLLENIESEEGVTSQVLIKEGGLDSYLEQIISYLLLMITIASVFYIIYGGVLYLTTDIVNEKLEGKEVITRVVTGLVFVFSIWTIMNSINPDLLKNSLNFSLKDLGVIIKSVGSGKGLPPSSTPTPSTSQTQIPITACTSGLETVQESYQLCKTVAENMRNLIDAAKKEGVTLTLSSAYRTNDRQIELRKKNCGTTNYDIYEKPSRLCSPQTAIPGTSNHERGLAVDFSGMQTQNAAYVWLTKNAGKYGFSNKLSVTKEPWHWSTNGGR